MNVYEEMISSFNNLCNINNTTETKVAPGAKLAKDKEELIASMRKDGYSEEEINMVVSISTKELMMAIKVFYDESLKSGITKSETPNFYHVAAQPGAGKSKAVEEIGKTLESKEIKPLISEMDKYRTRHPRIKEIKEMIAKKFPNHLEKQGKEFVRFTSLFADMFELSIISYMISQGYSVIKETTGKNSRGVCGLIDALKTLYPQMSASIACLAVAQEVSIDGTMTRGEAMNLLTDMFVKDLKSKGIDIKPVGRGNVPRQFSEIVCQQIPSSMYNIINSGLIDGEFIIATRAAIISKTSGAELSLKGTEIRDTLADRITGKSAELETEAHFSTKQKEKEEALVELLNDKKEKFSSLFIRPTMTWLGENEEAFDFYKKESGLVTKEEVAKWIIQNKMFSLFLSKTLNVDNVNIDREFQEYARNLEIRNLESIKAFVDQVKTAKQVKIFEDIPTDSNGKKM